MERPKRESPRRVSDEGLKQFDGGHHQNEEQEEPCKHVDAPFRAAVQVVRDLLPGGAR
jgi:hypothetical protein